MAPESATAPKNTKTAATASDLKRFLRRSGVSVPPSEERLRSLALDACSTHLDSARDCSDPALALAAMTLTVCPGSNSKLAQLISDTRPTVTRPCRL